MRRGSDGHDSHGLGGSYRYISFLRPGNSATLAMTMRLLVAALCILAVVIAAAVAYDLRESKRPRCGTKAPCSHGKTCVGGKCVSNCGDYPPCQKGQTCIDGECLPNCGDNPACADDQTCLHGECLHDCGTTGGLCPEGSKCVRGACKKFCAWGGPCPQGEKCVGGPTPESQKCKPVCGGVVCPEGQACVGDAECKPQCGGGAPCPVTKQCVFGDCVPWCSSDADCDPKLVCHGNGCVTPCDAAQCGAGQKCIYGACPQLCANTGACSAGEACYTGPQSGYVGVCTDTCGAAQVAKFCFVHDGWEHYDFAAPGTAIAGSAFEIGATTPEDCFRSCGQKPACAASTITDGTCFHYLNVSPSKVRASLEGHKLHSATAVRREDS